MARCLARLPHSLLARERTEASSMRAGSLRLVDSTSELDVSSKCPTEETLSQCERHCDASFVEARQEAPDCHLQCSSTLTTSPETELNYDLLRQWSCALPELREFYSTALREVDAVHEFADRAKKPAKQTSRLGSTRLSRPQVQLPVHAEPKPIVCWKRRQQIADRLWESLCKKLQGSSLGASMSSALVARLVEHLEGILYRRAVDGSTYANMASHTMKRIRTWSDAKAATQEAFWRYLTCHLASRP
ncbi:hypothetical protein F1559_003622 [Cyanidiococcus yangmingshanensis]|uniref:Uncharacterized protein n=1 Tax=Cyanidiococcus yangmingshanensis TaxID=2690220 RepID=A0A7J7IP29_9RHOD|nr:hypothetical protein F1559_003622 [Cyanidiococcus yangmingshanensis]